MKKYIYTIGMFLCSLTAMAQEDYCPPEWIPPGCPPHVPITDPINETGIVFEAANTITASNTIQNGASATYKAGNEITFIEGFDAVSGAALDALIEECISSITEPNDPLFCLQWGHYNTGQVRTYEEGVLVRDRDNLDGEFDADADILEAWEIITYPPLSNITVAIMDSGIDINHPDAVMNIDIDEIHPDFDASRIVEGQNFIAGETPSNYTDFCGHGTLVAGILGATANNNIGIAGVNQQCKIMPLKTVNDDCDPDEAALIQAIDYAIHPDRNNNRADIISMSFGLSTSYELEEAMRKAIDANVLLLAATGNNNNTNVHYPASHASVMGIGAMSPCNERKSHNSCDLDNRDSSWGSNYGDGLDLLAPGVLLPTTDIQGVGGYSQPGYQYTPDGNYLLDAYGTSIATPFAAGVAALVWAENPGLKNYQVRHILQQTATNIGTVEETGHGSINARDAVEMAHPKNFNPATDFLLPNLSLELISAPVTVNLGGTLLIECHVKNTGDAPAPASTLRYWFTDPTESNTTSTYVDVDPIPDEEEDVIYLDIDITPVCDGGDFIAGDYIINFEVDAALNPNDRIEEFNEFNEFRHQFEVTDGQPDLRIVENPAPVLTPDKGGYSLTYDVENDGSGQAYTELRNLPALYYKFYKYYASINNEWNPEDELIFSATQTLPQIKLCSQDFTPNQESVTIASGDIPPGTNYIIIQVDADNDIAESEIGENNNFYAVPLTQETQPIADPIAYSKAENSGEPKKNTSELVVSPNPFEESVSFEFYTKQNAKVALSIYDLEGKLHLEKKLNYQEEGQQLIEANLSTLSSGVYFYKLFVDQKPFSGKVIKK